MGLFALIAVFSVALSFQLALCASDQKALQKPHKQYGNSAVHQSSFAPPLLPRKFTLKGEVPVKRLGFEGISSRKILMEASSENKQNKTKEENVVHHAVGKWTWREWNEVPNKSEYFTMDYARVRRRPNTQQEHPICPIKHGFLLPI